MDLDSEFLALIGASDGDAVVQPAPAPEEVTAWQRITRKFKKLNWLMRIVAVIVFAIIVTVVSQFMGNLLDVGNDNGFGPWIGGILLIGGGIAAYWFFHVRPGRTKRSS